MALLCLDRGAPAAEIGPEDNLCAAINALQPGEELSLRPGEYRGPCSIRRGRPGQPVVIRAADPGQRPRVVYGGGTSNVFNVHADHVVIRGLEIGPTRADVDGVRIYAGAGVTVEDCVFTELGGIAVVANHSSVHDVVVRRNLVQASRATAMYFGCHDGVGCVVSGLVVEGNHIRGVEARPEEVGYGVQIKLELHRRDPRQCHRGDQGAGHHGLRGARPRGGERRGAERRGGLAHLGRHRGRRRPGDGAEQRGRGQRRGGDRGARLRERAASSAGS